MTQDRPRHSPPPTPDAPDAQSLARRVGHDLNNLLFVLEGNLELLRDTLPASQATAGQLEAIERSAQLIGMLAANLLTFAGRQTQRPETVDAATELAAGLAALRRILPASIAVEEQVAADLWPVRADARLLRYAVLNLGLNARDAMPEGGRLVVAAENRRLGPGDPMCEAVAQPGDYVVLRFQDSGSRTASPAGNGASLGLPMARTMARAVGGGLLVEPAAPDRGAQITLCLPRAA